MSLFIANKPMLMHRGTTTKDFKEAIRVPMAGDINGRDIPIYFVVGG